MPSELSYFNVGKEDFEEAEDVSDGLGPRMRIRAHASKGSEGNRKRDLLNFLRSL